jgi:hypothetical protein
MLMLWKSIGADVLVVANRDKAARWRRSVAKVSSLATDLEPMADLRRRFPKDVEALALETLSGNRALVVQEMADLGISTDPSVSGAQLTTKQEARIQELQDAAATVSRLQAAQEHARTLNVGWRRERASGAPPGAQGTYPGVGDVPPPVDNATYFAPVTYDPLAKPEFLEAPQDAPPFVNVLGKGSVVPYAQVDVKYAATVALVEFLLARFPELYAITRDGKSASTAAFAKETNPRAARDELGAGMHKLLADIDGAISKLGGALDVLDLVPLHSRMTQQGQKPAGGTVAWNDPVPSMIAKDVVADHDFNRALAALGIELAANALFIIAPFAGAGGLLVFLAGAGLLGGKAKMSSDRADALAQAARTAAAPGTALVDDATVDAAQRRPKGTRPRWSCSRSKRLWSPRSWERLRAGRGSPSWKPG